MTTYKEIESILTSYTLEEVLEYNDLAPEDALYFLVEQKFVELPDIKPLDYDD